MPAILTASDANLVRLTAPPKWRWRLARWMVLLAGIAVIAASASTDGSSVCADSSPCPVDPWGSVVIGLFLAMPLVALAHVQLAALISVLTAAAMLWLGPKHPEDPVPSWLYVVFAVAALWCVAWALFASAGRPSNSSSELVSGQLGWSVAASRPPEPNGNRWVGLRPGLVIGVFLVLAAAVAAGAAAYFQVSVDAQQRAARTVTAPVIGHPDEYTVRVGYPASASTDINVLETTGYPVDSQVRLAVDDQGLVQLLAEPYDVTVFYSLAIVVGLFGVALLWRARDFFAPRRRLFREPQPESVVYIRRRGDRVLLFAGNAGPAETPFAEIPVRDLLGQEDAPLTYRRPPFVEGTVNPALFGLQPDQVASQPESAVLYGRPVRGQWCTVRVGGQTLFPSGPLQATTDAIPFGSGARAGTG